MAFYDTRGKNNNQPPPGRTQSTPPGRQTLTPDPSSMYDGTGKKGGYFQGEKWVNYADTPYIDYRDIAANGPFFPGTTRQMYRDDPNGRKQHYPGSDRASQMEDWIAAGRPTGKDNGWVTGNTPPDMLPDDGSGDLNTVMLSGATDPNPRNGDPLAGRVPKPFPTGPMVTPRSRNGQYWYRPPGARGPNDPGVPGPVPPGVSAGGTGTMPGSGVGGVNPGNVRPAGGPSPGASTGQNEVGNQPNSAPPPAGPTQVPQGLINNTGNAGGWRKDFKDYFQRYGGQNWDNSMVRGWDPTTNNWDRPVDSTLGKEDYKAQIYARDSMQKAAQGMPSKFLDPSRYNPGTRTYR